MPKPLIQYRIFIGSPGGLEEERKLFAKKLDKCTRHDAEPRGVTFHPVGWEDTIAGVGRPQALINEDLKQCDYAVFVLHDRWGSPTGGGYTSETEEEWKLAEKLYEERKIRNIALFFKQVTARQLKDPGDQLKKVLEFKKQIEERKKYLFKSYKTTNDLGELLEAQLAAWLLDHEGTGDDTSSGAFTITGSLTAAAEVASPANAIPVGPGFDYWIAETDRLMVAKPPNYSGALFCAEKASTSASSDIEWARATASLGVAHSYLNDQDKSLAAFTAIAECLGSATDEERRGLTAQALLNKGFTLNRLGRGEEAIAVYDELLTRFEPAFELTLRGFVVKALVNKGFGLGELGRGEEAIAVYNDVVERFASASELILREGVARALVNKGATLGLLGRTEEQVTVYDEVIAGFGSASELHLRERVAKAMVSKGNTLSQLERPEKAITAYDDVVVRFGSESELPLQEQVAAALIYKGATLGGLGRSEEEAAVYDDLLVRFGSASELTLREEVARAMVNKGAALGRLDRNEEAIAIYDEVIAHFGSETESVLREGVARAMVNKGARLRRLGRNEEAIAVYDDVLAHFSSASDVVLRELVAKAVAQRKQIEANKKKIKKKLKKGR